jgi:N-acetylglucosamine kinase-like BadF-type ATPase
MVLIADSGSTKTDWALVGFSEVTVIQTQGINPVHQSREVILRIFRDELLPQLSDGEVRNVRFYGSGVRPDLESVVESVIRDVFPSASDVETHSDMLGAARALCGRNEGIACILGTGANSCLYNGNSIVGNTPAMGYILGDEGSGAWIGKRFLHDLYKGILPKGMLSEFEGETGFTLSDIINKVYREPLANRFLASLTRFVHCHKLEDTVKRLLVEGFRDFLNFNISPYQRRDLPVSFVGSIAYYFDAELREAADETGFTIGVIEKSPLNGMIKFEKDNLYET